MIKTLQTYQACIDAILGAAITAAFTSSGSFVARAAYDTVQSRRSLGDSVDVWMLLAACCVHVVCSSKRAPVEVGISCRLG